MRRSYSRRKTSKTETTKTGRTTLRVTRWKEIEAEVLSTRDRALEDREFRPKFLDVSSEEERSSDCPGEQFAKRTIFFRPLPFDAIPGCLILF